MNLPFNYYAQLLTLLKGDRARFYHSILVSQTVAKLLKHYHAYTKTAVLGALYHDCCKNFNEEDYLSLLGEKIYYRLKDKLILHGYGAYRYCRDNLGIKDKNVLKGIKHHTEMRKTNNIITKVIFLADKIAPLRNYPKVNLLRALSYQNIDLALLLFLEYQAKFLARNNLILGPNSLKLRTYLLNKGVSIA